MSIAVITLKKSKKEIFQTFIKISIGIVAILVFWDCPFHMLGYSCPGCGMSRALVTVLKLDFTKAFYYHPLWPLVVIIVIHLLIRYLYEVSFSDKNELRLYFVIMLVFIVTYLYRLLVIDSPIVRFR